MCYVSQKKVKSYKTDRCLALKEILRGSAFGSPIPCIAGLQGRRSCATNWSDEERQLRAQSYHRYHYHYIRQGRYVFIGVLFVCLQDYAKTTRTIFTKFGGKWHMSHGRNLSISVVILVRSRYVGVRVGLRLRLSTACHDTPCRCNSLAGLWLQVYESDFR